MLLVRVLLGLGLIAASVVAVPARGGARVNRRAAATPTSLPGIDVVQVEGLIDPPNASLVRHSIGRAEHRHSTLLVFQLDSGGAVDVDIAALAARVTTAKVPIAVWIGPSGATARGGAALFAESAAVLSISPGSHIGPARRGSTVPVPRSRRRSTPGCRGPAGHRRQRPTADRRTRSTRRRVRGARGRPASTTCSAISIVGLDNTDRRDRGRDRCSSRPRRSSATGNGRRRRPNQDVRFARARPRRSGAAHARQPVGRVHALRRGAARSSCSSSTRRRSGSRASRARSRSSVGSPASRTCRCSGGRSGLLVLGILGFTIDVQAGGLGPWTAIGAIALVAGSLTLYGGSSRLDPAWWSIVIVCGTHRGVHGRWDDGNDSFTLRDSDGGA